MLAFHTAEHAVDLETVRHRLGVTVQDLFRRPATPPDDPVDHRLIRKRAFDGSGPRWTCAFWESIRGIDFTGDKSALPTATLTMPLGLQNHAHARGRIAMCFRMRWIAVRAPFHRLRQGRRRAAKKAVPSSRNLDIRRDSR